MIEVHAVSDSAGSASIRVENGGVGPAIIDSVGVGLAVPGDNVSYFRSWIDAAQAFQEIGLRATSSSEIGEGTIIGAGKEQILAIFEIPPTEDSFGRGSAVDALLDRLRMRIDYSSIYGDEFEAVFPDT